VAAAGVPRSRAARFGTDGEGQTSAVEQRRAHRDLDPDDLLAVASPDQLLAMAAKAVARQGADMATAQLVARTGRLVLVAHVGLEQRFAEHFAVVDDERSACGAATGRATVVEVPDVADDPIFNGTENQQVVLAAGSKAVTSFPIANAAGQTIGVVSAHYRSPGRHDLRPVRSVVQQVERLLAPAQPVRDGVEVPIVENLQLRRALSSRGLIGMAKGILMASAGVDEDEAFAMLVRASQRENVRLRDVAARIVTRHGQRIRGDDHAPEPGEAGR
jgi:hypothetical protein